MKRGTVIVLAAAAATLIIASSGAQTPSTALSGSTQCARCHPGAYRVWQASAHARANANLPSENRADSRCLRCHGGSEEGVGGVQCETCHGPGKVYARRHVMKDRELALLVGMQRASIEYCVRCHTETGPRLQKFAQEKAWLLIKHGREPRKTP